MSKYNLTYLLELKYANGIMFNQRVKEGKEPIAAAREYAHMPVKGDAIRVFGFPLITRGDSRNNRGNGAVDVAFYNPDATDHALDLLEAHKPTVFHIMNNVVKITRFEFMAMMNALRAPLNRVNIPWLSSLSASKSVAALYSNKGKGWELEVYKRLKELLGDNAEVIYTGSLLHGHTNDLLQTVDIVVKTNIPIEFW